MTVALKFKYLIIILLYHLIIFGSKICFIMCLCVVQKNLKKIRVEEKKIFDLEIRVNGGHEDVGKAKAKVKCFGSLAILGCQLEPPWQKLGQKKLMTFLRSIAFSSKDQFLLLEKAQTSFFLKKNQFLLLEKAQTSFFLRKLQPVPSSRESSN